MSVLRLEELYPTESHVRLRYASTLHRLLTDAGPASADLRARVDALLAEARARSWINEEAVGRLRAGDDSVVLPMIDELFIARWLDRAGYGLAFNPPGAGARIGELLISRASHEIFVEVKSLLQAEALVLYEVTVARLREISALVDVPALLTIEIDSTANSGINGRDLRTYFQLGAQQLLEGGPPPPAYMHASGVHLRAIHCEPQPGAPHLQLTFLNEEWPGQLANEQRLWGGRLWRSIRGGYSQLPHGGPPTLMIVVDHATPLDLPAWISQVRDMLRMGNHRHLSAVMRLLGRDLWLDRPQPTVLLNPHAAAPLTTIPITADELWLSVLPG